MIFQAHLDTFAIFVDYADFYVNAVMSTFHLINESSFAIFDFGTTSSGTQRCFTLNIVFARSLARFCCLVNSTYLTHRSVQVNDIASSYLYDYSYSLLSE